MLNPINIRAMGEAKQARYLKEAEGSRLLKASKAGQPTIALRLVRILGQWRVLVSQQAHEAVAQFARKWPEEVKGTPGR